MRFNKLYVRYCCEELKRFLDKVETTKAQWKEMYDPLVRIGFQTSTGPMDTWISYCPFCPAKIEWDDNLNCEKREDTDD